MIICWLSFIIFFFFFCLFCFALFCAINLPVPSFCGVSVFMLGQLGQFPPIFPSLSYIPEACSTDQCTAPRGPWSWVVGPARLASSSDFICSGFILQWTSFGLYIIRKVRLGMTLRELCLCFCYLYLAFFIACITCCYFSSLESRYGFTPEGLQTKFWKKKSIQLY